MSENMKSIRIILDDEEGNSQAVKLTGIPASTWEAFAKRAGKALDVDDEKRAWGKIFAAVIESEFLTREIIVPYMKSQKHGEYTFLLSGIPLEARDKLEMAASQANLTPDLMVALMYDAAMNDQFHALSLKPVEDHTGFHVMIVTGITTETWDAWGQASKKLKEVTGEDVRPDNFLGYLLEKALWGQISVVSDDPKVNNPEAYEIKTAQREANTATSSVETEVMRMKAKMDELLTRLNENDNANKDN